MPDAPISASTATCSSGLIGSSEYVPGVSTNCQSCVCGASFARLYRYCPQVMDTVVPGAFIVRVLAPSSALNMEDLPTFGLPTNTTRFIDAARPASQVSPRAPSRTAPFADVSAWRLQRRQQSSCELQQSPPLRSRRFIIRAYSRSLRVTQRRLAYVRPA